MQAARQVSANRAAHLLPRLITQAADHPGALLTECRLIPPENLAVNGFSAMLGGMTLWFGLGILGLLAGGALLYWLFIATEGVFLGSRMVIWLYNVTARRYNAIKQYTPDEERELVVNPVLEELAYRQTRHPRLLDVATGAGRVPYDLLSDGRFGGRIVALDASWGMLGEAARSLTPYRGRVDLIQQKAGALPFGAAQFDGVISLEALEFFPSDTAALGEMTRVLRPGGFLMVTRRRGRQARLFLHRYRSLLGFESLLYDLGLIDVITCPWESNYDLVLARKPSLDFNTPTDGRD